MSRISAEYSMETRGWGASTESGRGMDVTRTTLRAVSGRHTVSRVDPACRAGSWGGSVRQTEPTCAVNGTPHGVQSRSRLPGGIFGDRRGSSSLGTVTGASWESLTRRSSEDPARQAGSTLRCRTPGDACQFHLIAKIPWHPARVSGSLFPRIWLTTHWPTDRIPHIDERMCCLLRIDSFFLTKQHITCPPTFEPRRVRFASRGELKQSSSSFGFFSERTSGSGIDSTDGSPEPFLLPVSVTDSVIRQRQGVGVSAHDS